MRSPMVFATILAALVTVTPIWAADPATNLPPSDTDLLDHATEAALAKPLKQYETYAKSLDDAAPRVLKELDKVKAAAMKSGNLKLAVAVDAKEKQITGAWLNDLVVSRAGYGNEVDLLGQPIVKILVKADKARASAGSHFGGDDYPDMLYGFGEGGFVEFTAALPKGTYYLYALMAAQDSRPCAITVNGAPAGTGFAITTGSWTQDTAKADKIGPFPANGATTIRIETVDHGLAACFYGFMIANSPDAALTVADFAKAGAKP